MHTPNRLPAGLSAGVVVTSISESGPADGGPETLFEEDAGGYGEGEYTLFRGVSRRSLSREVADYVRHQIVTGALRRGEKIPQDEVAGQLGLSRLPVREALIMLAGDGLVELRARRGAFVAEISRADIEDQYAIYGVVHGLAAARLVVAPNKEEVIAQLAALNERLKNADRSELMQIGAEFHRVINFTGGSHRQRTVLRALVRSVPAGFFEVDGSSELALNGHIEILNAIRGDDSDVALTACAKHLKDEAQLVIQQLERRGFWEAS
jgi:DNA-binding GntR family transcriptional regulator